MKAIQLEKPFHFHQINIPEPADPGTGEALVRVHRVGICGTDYSGYQGKMPFYSYPRIPGHELGVEVLAVGPGVTSVKRGDRCSVEPYMNCRKCYSCGRGHSNCCEHLQTLGVHCDGGLRPLFSLPAAKLHVSTRLTHDQLALVETLAIGCHAVNRGNPSPRETVLVVGAGPIGLSVIEFAKLSGARTLVMDQNPRRLGFVREKMKIADTIEVKEDRSEEKLLTGLTEGKLADVVIDATGNPRSMSRAPQLAAFAGRVVYVGITPQDFAIADPLLHRRELTLLASRNALPADFQRIISLIEAGQIDTRPWISHQADFEQMIGEFNRWMLPETGVIKAIVGLDGV